MKMDYLRQAWLVIVLSAGFGAALAGVQTSLQERIAANKLAETKTQIPVLVEGAETGKAEMIADRTVYRALAGEKQVGWVIPAGGQGFADRIEVLVGLDKELARITGLYVLDQKETPGLGNKIIDESWRAQFVGKPTAPPLVVVKSGASKPNDIDAVTGATISSEAVCDIVNRTVSEMSAELGTSQ